MPEIKSTWTHRLRRLLNGKPLLKPYLVDAKYKVIPAFSIGGVDYWMYDSTTELPTGRFFAAMGVYAEMEMNVDKAYLDQHVKAMDKILSDPKKISLKHVLQLNTNLKERLELMPMPEYIYKLASVIFFDTSESLYAYDYDYNAKKIEKWKSHFKNVQADGGLLGFFSQTPLKELVPSLNLPEKDTQTYLTVTKFITEIHREHLTAILQAES